jgi:hypothetical protein
MPITPIIYLYKQWLEYFAQQKNVFVLSVDYL